MPEQHSNAEFATVDRARRIFDLTLPMLRRLVDDGRVRARVGPDGRLRLSIADLRTVANALDLNGYHALARAAGDGDSLPEPWASEATFLDRAWTGHTTERIWQGEQAHWRAMGRTLRR